ncbi:MAG: molybdopterin cofactor-binding domain-containing protein, partial [Aestuariivirgaceae bacterium]
MTGKTSITRRVFVIGSAVIGGAALAGLGIGTGYLATVDVDGTGSGPGEGDSVNLTSWINIGTDNLITINVPFVEMGQGTHTGLAQLVAEELGLDLTADNVRVIHPREEFSAHTNWTMFLNQRPEEMSGPLSWYGKRFLATMKLSATGGSTAVVGNWHAMRQAGAIARQMLRTAAARHLDASADDLVLQHAAFSLADASNSVAFGTIAKAAAAIDPPADVVLKPASEFKVIGKPIPRVDVPAKITGKGQYGVDVRLPDMAFATVRQAPVFGARVRKVDDKEARGMRGVIDVIVDDDATIVVADNTWRAFQAAEALEIEYELPEEPVAGDHLASGFETGLSEGAFTQSEQPGDAAEALSSAAKTVAADYRTPYLAHATMEPMNCTVLWTSDDAVEIWAPTQSAAMARQVIETIGGASSIKVHVTFAGGGFGRRAEKNFVIHAAKAAKAHKGRPIQLTWSRPEDMQHDVYRPAAIAKMKAGLDDNGQLTAFDAVIGTHSVMASFLLRNMDMSSNLTADATTLEGIAHMP